MKSKNKLNLFGTIAITIGVFLIVIGVGYEAVNYPWRLLLKNDNYQEIVSMQPDELGQPFTFFDEAGAEKVENVVSLPASNQSLPIAREKKVLSLMGAIKIPKIGISENIVEGVDEEILYAVGHLPGTALPGQSGNSVLAGHRNYVWMHPFKYLNKMEIGDQIIVDMYKGEDTVSYTYEIYDIITVKPEDTWVAENNENEDKVLTLITCTPIPSYTDRLICFARIVNDDNYDPGITDKLK